MITERNISSFLEKVLKTEKQIADIASGEIVFSPALINRDGIPVIRRGTINVIQGRQGSHKSRLAELFCSLMIRKENCPELSLSFERDDNEVVTVCYIDTERNKKEEFPVSVQKIIRNAGFNLPSDIPEFRYTSLKDITRSERLKVLKSFVEKVKENNLNPLFVVLDVVTDCIGNFNDPAESMQLLDYIGNLTENNDATFFLVIHENPGGEKARGHVGTEAINKASTVMRIGFQKKYNIERRDKLSLEFLKNRHSDRLPAISLRFSKDTNSLVLNSVDSDAVLDSSTGKAAIEQVILKLSCYLRPSSQQGSLIKSLTTDFGCSQNTIKSRLQQIADENLDVVNEHSVPCKLKIVTVSGKPTIYELIELPLENLM